MQSWGAVCDRSNKNVRNFREQEQNHILPRIKIQRFLKLTAFFTLYSFFLVCIQCFVVFLFYILPLVTLNWCKFSRLIKCIVDPRTSKGDGSNGAPKAFSDLKIDALKQSK